MSSPLQSSRRWAPAAIVAVGLGCASMAPDPARTLALINESPSLPRGLYVRQPGAAVARGAIVAVPQPAGTRAYLGGLGMPGDVLLIKRVAAVQGDMVCRDGLRVTAPARVVTALARDRTGAALPVWRGCRLLGEHELFLLGDTATSFDGRYFGVTARASVTGVYREAFRW